MTDKELLDCLTDRPCDVCKFHKEKGCTEWKCVFDQREHEPKTGWISVKEYTPLIGEEVLLCDYDGNMYISYLHTDGRWGCDDCGNKLKNIVAWQPLPEPHAGSEEV